MALMEATRIGKAFGGLRALHEVDIAISGGELVGLIGPNGAGKTTLVNVLSGYYKPTSGRVTLDGQDVTSKKVAEIATKGMVRSFQQSFIFKNLTVLENAIIGHHLFERPGLAESIFSTRTHRAKELMYRQKAEEILEVAGLGHLRSEPAGSLPYGYQKLLGMAVAASGKPKVLLLDEPVAGMNSGEIDQALDFVLKLKQQGLGILLIEHNVGAIMAICDRIVVLNFGQKIADGASDEICQDPEVIKAYLGDALDAS